MSKRWRATAAEKAAATEALTSAIEKDDVPAVELRAALKRGDLAVCDQALLQQGRDELAKRDAAEAAKLAEGEAARKAAAEAEAARVAEVAEMEKMSKEDTGPEPVAATEDGETKQSPEEQVPADSATGEASTEGSAEHAPADATSAAGPPNASDSDVTMQDATAIQSSDAVEAPTATPHAQAPMFAAPPPGVPKPPPAVPAAVQPAPAFLHRPDAQMQPTLLTALSSPAGVSMPVASQLPASLPGASPVQASAKAQGPVPAAMGGDVTMEASWALFTKEVEDVNVDASLTQP